MSQKRSSESQIPSPKAICKTRLSESDMESEIDSSDPECSSDSESFSAYPRSSVQCAIRRYVSIITGTGFETTLEYMEDDTSMSLIDKLVKLHKQTFKPRPKLNPHEMYSESYLFHPHMSICDLERATLACTRTLKMLLPYTPISEHIDILPRPGTGMIDATFYIIPDGYDFINGYDTTYPRGYLLYCLEEVDELPRKLEIKPPALRGKVHTCVQDYSLVSSLMDSAYTQLYGQQRVHPLNYRITQYEHGALIQEGSFAGAHRIGGRVMRKGFGRREHDCQSGGILYRVEIQKLPLTPSQEAAQAKRYIEAREDREQYKKAVAIEEKAKKAAKAEKGKKANKKEK
jgi:hypothetical protein